MRTESYLTSGDTDGCKAGAADPFNDLNDVNIGNLEVNVRAMAERVSSLKKG